MTDPTQYIEGRTVQEQMNSLISYVDTRAEEVANAAVADEVADCQQAVTDAQDARDAAVAAKDTAVSTVSDCVKMTPSAAQTITGYPLTVSQGVIGNVTGNVTGDVTGDIASSGTSAFSGTVTVPTVTTGTADTRTANGQKVINELDAYSPMVRNTGNMTISGYKTFTSQIANKISILDRNTAPTTRSYRDGLLFTDGSDNEMGALSLVYLPNGDRAINMVLYDRNGNRIEKTVFQIDQDGNVIE